MILTLPLVIYRYLKNKNIPEINKPLICIFTAVLSIIIVGYLNSSQNPSQNFVLILYSISCIFYLFSLYKFISYRNLDFYPTFAAFTFPFVISALSTKETYSLIKPNIVLANVLSLETVIAIVIVCYVLLRYLKFLKIVKK